MLQLVQPVSICTHRLCTEWPPVQRNSWWQTERKAGSPGAVGHQISLAGGLASGQQGNKVRRGYPTTSVLIGEGGREERRR